MLSNLPPGVTQEQLDEQFKDSPEEIRDVTEKAIERGLYFANPEWKNMALSCVEAVCLKKATFTTNDVRWLVEASPIKTHDKRAMGGIMKKAEKLGWIVQTGLTVRSKVGHGVPLQIWKSKLFKGDTSQTLF